MAETVASGWRKAVTAMREVLTGIDESQMAACLGDDGDTWCLAELLLREKMVGQPVPFEDRQAVDGNWRRVMITVADSEACDAQLRDESGAAIDEAETPGGVLQLQDGNSSLCCQYGSFYRLAPEGLAALSDDDGNEDEAAAALPDNDDEDAADDDGGDDDDGGENVEGDKVEGASRVKDMTRMMWKGEPVTLRTREGSGDTTIAATKVRLLQAEPAAFLVVLRDDVERALEAGDARLLLVDEEQTDSMPVEVLRGDKHVIGTLYNELQWCFAGLPCMPCVLRVSRVPATHAVVWCGMCMERC